MRLVWWSAACQNWDSMFASHIGIWSLGIWRFVVPVSLRAVNDCTNANMNRQMSRGSLNIARDLFEVEILTQRRYTPSSDLHSAAPTSNDVHQPIGYEGHHKPKSSVCRNYPTMQYLRTARSSWCGRLDARGEAGAISDMQTSFSASPTPAFRDAQVLGEKTLGGSFALQSSRG